jgi:hypothetical protein
MLYCLRRARDETPFTTLQPPTRQSQEIIVSSLSTQNGGPPRYCTSTCHPRASEVLFRDTPLYSILFCRRSVGAVRDPPSRIPFSGR